MEETSFALDLAGKAYGIIRKGIEHKNTLRSLKSTMKELAPVVEEMKKYYKTTDQDIQEMESLSAMMGTVQEVIRKCSRDRWWKFFLLPCYQGKLAEAHESLVRYTSVHIPLQMARDVRKIRARLSSDDSRTAQTKRDDRETSPAVNLSLDTASSSGASRKYDVFISFRGEDTRHGFTSHLYAALNDAGIKTYADYRLAKGEELTTSTMSAIEESTLCIVILSQNYASSRWRLAELEKILECHQRNRQLVMPVFYNVDPSDVRKQYGSYLEAFERQRQFALNEEKIQLWKDALAEIADLPGRICTSGDDEVELVEEIVQDVTETMYPKVHSPELFKKNQFRRLHQNQEGSSSNVTKSSLRPQVVGGKNKKARVYGLGSPVDLLNSYDPPCNHGEPTVQLKQCLEEQARNYETSLANVLEKMKEREEKLIAQNEAREEVLRAQIVQNQEFIKQMMAQFNMNMNQSSSSAHVPTASNDDDDHVHVGGEG